MCGKLTRDACQTFAEVSPQEYFSAASKLHSTQVRAFLAACHTMVKKTGEEDGDGTWHIAGNELALTSLQPSVQLRQLLVVELRLVSAGLELSFDRR